jgi:hypothetical protein
MIRRFALSLAFAALPAAAQCVMCARSAAAQNQERLTALMNGVVVLLIPPVTILTALLVVAWRRGRS